MHVVIEGPAGIGKTALLEAAREATADLNVRLAHARASELDRSYVFGIVHQLLEPIVVGVDEARRAELFAGAASLSRRGASAPVPMGIGRAVRQRAFSWLQGTPSRGVCCKLAQRSS